MKTDYWLIVVAVLVLAALAGGMHLHTLNTEQAKRIAGQAQDLAEAHAQIAALTPEPYVLPVANSWVSSGVGYRTNPMGGGQVGLHQGRDYPGEIGEPVRVMRPGVVVEHWLAPGVHHGKRYYGHTQFGGYIVVDHGGGSYSKYGHLSATFVHEGQSVEMGQVIGLLGQTGIATGPHVHWEVVVDPLRYLSSAVPPPEAALRWRIPR